ncbi:MAG: leucine--tRNA ligase [Erysipelotrichaceae bacterium]
MYNHLEIEKKWQEYWDKHQTFKTDVYDFSKPKFYALDMFPYPSGQGLHVGHPEGYTASDIVCRMKRMQGFNVLHPMGFDSFGLPAEQYAINTGNHPEKFTLENIKTFKEQLSMIGLSFDWDKEISTCDPNYYKWTQWIFKNLYADGLAKYVDMPVNWCEELGTVLANDEIIDGKSERGGYPVVKKNMKQWVIDIVKYADRLIDNLDKVDWPNSTKEMQKNWIGKSIGASVDFKVNGSEEYFTVFTTRCDTLFGATYCVLAPEHPLVDKITTSDKKDEVAAYIKECASKSEIERTANKEKSGVFTGAYAINPVNDKLIPIYISDYVLISYGTGSIMAVPAHDERDYAFAKKFNIDIIEVLQGGDISKEAYTQDGLHVNSGFLNGLNKEDAIITMLDWLEEKGIGKKKINYKLREWIFARQRYWGEPIPVVHLEDGSTYVLKDSELPLVLPTLDDYKPAKSGSSPLDKASDWVNVTIDGIKGKRETSTMPGSAGSSWYYLRYIDPKNEKMLADPKLLEHWMPVDLYIGGPEHAVGHLLYARMFNQYLFDKGIVKCEEPFKKLVHQGMILGANGIKMGKRFPEYIVDPKVIVKNYGGDTLRVYEMFMGPLEADKPWNEQSVEGSYRWIDRVYRLVESRTNFSDENSGELDYSYNYLIKKATSDIESLNLNTVISQMMIFINDCYKAKSIYVPYIEGFVQVFSCFAPYVGEELWEMLGHNESIAYYPWPTFDESKCVLSEIEIGVQVNGKMRGKLVVEKDMPKEELEKLALEIPNVIVAMDNKPVRKLIIVPNKIVNIVV